MDISFLLSTATGAFAGAAVGSHFKGGLWKGAALGGAIAASIDIATPDTDRNRGIIWNSLAGGMSSALLAAAGSLASAGFFPGGKFSSIMKARLLGKLKKAKGVEKLSLSESKNFIRATLGLRSQHGFPHGHLGRGGLGFYPVSENYPEPVKYILGLPNVANLIVEKGTRFSRLGGKEFQNALLKDIGMSSMYSAGIGMAMGAMYSLANTPIANQRTGPIVPGSGMTADGRYYAPVTNRPLNPIY